MKICRGMTRLIVGFSAVAGSFCLGEFRVEGDVALLEALRDAQATNRALFSRGHLVAEVRHRHLEPNAGRCERVSHVDFWWDGDKAYSRRSTETTCEKRKVSPGLSEVISRPDGYHVFSAAQRYVQSYPAGYRGLIGPADLRPSELWEHPMFARKTWSEDFDPRSPGFPAAERMSVKREGGLILVHRYYPGGSLLRIIADLRQGGNVVEFAGTDDTGELMADGKYTWQDDGRGNWRLQLLQYRWAHDGRLDDELPYLEVEIKEFDSAAKIPPDRFEARSFGLAQGTTIFEFDNTGRVKQRRMIGREVDPAASDDRLDELAAQLRSQGYASPARRP